MQRRTLVLPVLSLFLLIALCCTLLLATTSSSNAHAAAPTDDWLTYQHDSQATGYNGAETTLTPANVTHLQLHWSHTSTTVTAQPVIYHGVVYWGDWSGFENAYTISGTKLWSTQIGVTNDPGCDPNHIGVDSTASVGTVGSTPAIFVGAGGNVNADGHANLVALNAQTGAVLWKTDIGTAKSPAIYQFGSPTYVDGHIYIGTASLCDQPLIQGQVLKINATTGKIEATFNAVPAGCIGGGVWGTPAVTTDGHVYVSTGNPGKCSVKGGEPLAFNVVELNASNLSVVGHWHAFNSSSDLDFSGVTTFSAKGINYVGAINKNGLFYALRQNNLGAGAVWTARIGNSSTCPQCQGNIAPGAFDGTRLYVGSGKVSGCSAGNVVALNPATGAVIWRHCLSGPVLGAITAFPGVVVVGAGNNINVLNASTGTALFTYATGAKIWGAPSIGEGMIFCGNLKGALDALGL